jgi:hypothetical protein
MQLLHHAPLVLTPPPPNLLSNREKVSIIKICSIHFLQNVCFLLLQVSTAGDERSDMHKQHSDNAGGGHGCEPALTLFLDMPDWVTSHSPLIRWSITLELHLNIQKVSDTGEESGD